MSRFDAAPLIAFSVPKATDEGTDTEGLIRRDEFRKDAVRIALSSGLTRKQVADITLDRQFEVDASDTLWVTDIACIRTLEGWSYLAVVIDLFSRRVVGWSMQSRMTTDLALQALLSAVWRR